jgi:hypothetical protein
VASALCHLAALFERLGHLDAAATVYGAGSRHPNSTTVLDLASTVDRLGAALGEREFLRRRAAGAVMAPAEAVRYARANIDQARRRGVDFSATASPGSPGLARS